MLKKIHSIIFVILLGFILFPTLTQAFTLTRSSNMIGLNSGLVGWWTFDGRDMTNGRANDASGNGNHGNLINIATSTFYKPGKIGQGFNFDGVNDNITVAHNSVLNPPEITVSFWLKVNTTPSGSGGSLVQKNVSTDYRIRFAGNGVVQFLQNSLSVLSSSNNIFTLNQWVHVTLVSNSAGTAFYRNAVVHGSNSTAYAVPSSSGTVLLGSVTGANYVMDDVRIYSRALSATEIRQLYSIGQEKMSKTVDSVNSLKTGLVGHWTFDGPDTTGGVARDKSGQGNNGNLINIATSTFYTNGKIGQGFNFDGVNDLVRLGRKSVHDFGSNDFSVSAWVYDRQTGTFDTFISRFELSLGIGWSLEHISSTRFSFQLVNIANGLTRADFLSWTINKWHHVVAVRRGGVSEIWVDGVKGTNSTASGSYDTTNGELLFGAQTIDLSAASRGSLDDPRIYSRALSATEIRQLYSIGQEKMSKTVDSVNSLKTGLVGHWTFDGPDTVGGVARDKSGQGNNGALTNISTSTFYTNGKIGQGFRFDGVDDYINIPSSSSLTNIWDNGGTVSFWIKPKTAGEGEAGFMVNKSGFWTIFSYSSHSAGQTGLEFNIVWSGSTAKWRNDTVPPISFNKWHHVILTYNSSGINNDPSVYIDGVFYNLVEITAPSGTRSSDSSSVNTIGSNTATSRTSDAIIDDVRIYNKVLSVSEVLKLYNQGR